MTTVNIQTGASVNTGKLAGEERGGIPVGKLIPIYGELCCTTSLICENCIGCTGRDTCLCLSMQNKCCRTVSGETANDTCCVIVEGSCELVVPKTCCYTQNQCFCIDERGAFPCTKQSPAVCTILPFCTIFPKIGCCMKMQDLYPDIFLKAGGATNITIQTAPQPQMVMQQPQMVMQQQPQMMMQQQPGMVMQQQPPQQVQMQRANNYVVQ